MSAARRKVGAVHAPERFYDARHRIAYDSFGRVHRRCPDCGETWPDHTAAYHELAFFGLDPNELMTGLVAAGARPLVSSQP